MLCSGDKPGDQSQHRQHQEWNKGGKLRLMYEANPMSFLVEQAGGAASTGRMRMLEVTPSGLHMRVPVFMGSKAEVDAAVGYHQAHDAQAH